MWRVFISFSFFLLFTFFSLFSYFLKFYFLNFSPLFCSFSSTYTFHSTEKAIDPIIVERLTKTQPPEDVVNYYLSTIAQKNNINWSLPLPTEIIEKKIEVERGITTPPSSGSGGGGSGASSGSGSGGGGGLLLFFFSLNENDLILD